MALRLSENKKWHGRIFRYVPLFLWLCLIFFLSTRQGSMSETSIYAHPILRWFFPNASESTLIFYHKAIRKSAHLFEYGVLAFFASRVFWYSSKKVLRKYWYLFAFLLVLIVASIDETNQSFNETRVGSVEDVLLDCLGGLLMIMFLFFVQAIWKKKTKK